MRVHKAHRAMKWSSSRSIALCSEGLRTTGESGSHVKLSSSGVAASPSSGNASNASWWRLAALTERSAIATWRASSIFARGPVAFALAPPSPNCPGWPRPVSSRGADGGSLLLPTLRAFPEAFSVAPLVPMLATFETLETRKAKGQIDAPFCSHLNVAIQNGELQRHISCHPLTPLTALAALTSTQVARRCQLEYSQPQPRLTLIPSHQTPGHHCQGSISSR